MKKISVIQRVVPLVLVGLVILGTSMGVWAQVPSVTWEPAVLLAQNDAEDSKAAETKADAEANTSAAQATSESAAESAPKTNPTQGKPETWKIALMAGFEEDERAPSMDIVRQIRSILGEMKFQVKFVNDYELSRAQCQAVCKSWGANLSLASGFNSYTNKEACGITVYIHPEKAGSGSSALAEKALSEIANIPVHKHEQRNCGVRQVPFPMCSCDKTGCEASVLVKYAFSTNPNEAHKYVNNPDAQREYAIAVCKAICAYTGVTYSGLQAVQPAPESTPEPTSTPAPASNPEVAQNPPQPQSNGGLPNGVRPLRGTIKAGERGLIRRSAPGGGKVGSLNWGHTAKVIGIVTTDRNYYYLEDGTYVNGDPDVGTFTPE